MQPGKLPSVGGHGNGPSPNVHTAVTTRSGTTLSVEIERKFLVARPPEDLAAWDAQRVEQGYIAITDEAEVRVRRRGDTYTLTIKSSPALARIEEELTIDDACFESLWPLTLGRRVVKTRHVRDAGGGLTYELDVYEGALEGLRTLEVELPDEAAAESFTPPPWAGADVTGDARYANQALALHGLPVEGR
jgi:CYTH domain-containing protein